MAGCRRWISSMNRTSRGCRLVRMAARSPARWITGPEVARKPTPSSRATICASVVLPRPGGPCSSTWSSASPRARAAWMKTARFSREAFWPTNSARVCGRRRGLGGVLGRRAGETVRSVSLMRLEFAGTRGWRGSGGRNKSGTTDAHGCTQMGRRVPKQRGSVRLDPEVWLLNRMQAAVPSVCICSVCTCVHLWFQSLALPALARAGHFALPGPRWRRCSGAATDIPEHRSRSGDQDGLGRGLRHAGSIGFLSGPI